MSSVIGIRAGRGRRDPALLARRQDADDTPGGPPPVFVTVRALKHGVYVVPPGVEMPGAHTWPRLEAMVVTRRLRAVELDEPYERWSDFEARALAAGTTDPGPRRWKTAALVGEDDPDEVEQEEDAARAGERRGPTEVREPVLAKDSPARKTST